MLSKTKKVNLSEVCSTFATSSKRSTRGLNNHILNTTKILHDTLDTYLSQGTGNDDRKPGLGRPITQSIQGKLVHNDAWFSGYKLDFINDGCANQSMVWVP